MKHSFGISMDYLESILYDVYKSDAYFPPLLSKWSTEYKKQSYSQWAIDELLEYIRKRLYPRREASIDEIYDIAEQFSIKMSCYSKMNERTSIIFRCACMMTDNVLDVLDSMC